jgi:hypothetical protein
MPCRTAEVRADENCKNLGTFQPSAGSDETCDGARLHFVGGVAPDFGARLQVD